MSSASFQGSSLDTSFGRGGGYVFSGQTIKRKLFAPLPAKQHLNIASFWNGRGGKVLDLLPKDLKKAEFQLKMSRIRTPMLLVTTLQILLILLFSLLFPRSYCTFESKVTFGLSYMCDAFATALRSVFSTYFVIITVPLLLVVVLLARFISGPKKVGKDAQVSGGRRKLKSFIWNPIVLGILVVGYFLLFISFSDPEYTSFGVHLPISSTDQDIRGEQLFVIRLIVFVGAVDFFADNLKNGEFTMDMPTNHVTWTLLTLLILEVKNNVKKSSVLGLYVWACYLLVYRPLYAFAFGSAFKDEQFFESTWRLFSHLVFNAGFLLRVFLYSLMTRISLRLYLKIINRHVSQRCNLPLNGPPAMAEPLLLFDAMKAENSFLQHLAFAQFYSKADIVDVDTLTFFQLSHPGNHPVHWRTAFTICCNLLNETNSKIAATFFAASKLPLNMQRIRLKPLTEKSGDIEPSKQNNSGQNTHPQSMRTVMRDLSAVPDENPQQSNMTLQEMVVADLWKTWEDVKTIPKSFGRYLLRLLQSTPDLMPYPLAITKVPEQVQISNLLVDHMLVYWAMMGTMKLFCCSVHGRCVDPRNIVFQDVDCFIKTMIDIYGSFIYMETYLDHMLDLFPNVNKGLLEHHKKIASRLSNTSILVLTEMHYKFSPFYDIIGVPLQRHSRICEILGSKKC